MKSKGKADRTNLDNQNGITLIELLIVIGIMGVVMSLGFSFLMFGTRTFKLSGERADNQFDVRMPTDFVSKEVRYADKVQILTSVPASQPANTYDIYLDASDQLIYNKNGVITTIPGVTGVDDYTFNVSRTSLNTLEYKIGKSGTTKYDVTTQVVILNIEASGIDGTGPGIGIRFTMDAVITGNPIIVASLD